MEVFQRNVNVRTWFGGGLCSVGLMSGLGDLRDLFQSEQFYVSMIGYKIIWRGTELEKGAKRSPQSNEVRSSPWENDK